MRTPIILTIVLCILAGCCASSCRFETELDRKLALAENLIAVDPDSACAVLNDHSIINLLEGASQRNNAIYSLLLVKANLAVSGKCPYDFFLGGAVDYFQTEGPSAYLVEALLLQSYFFRMDSCYNYAVGPAMKAFNAAVEMGDLRLQAKAAEELASIFRETYHFRDAREYSILACDFYKESGEESAFAESKARMAFDSAESGSIIFYEEFLGDIDPVLRDKDEGERLFADACLSGYMKNGEYVKAEFCGDTLLKYGSAMRLRPVSRLYIDVAVIKTELGKFEEADSLLAASFRCLSSPGDSLRYYSANARLRQKTGDIQAALVSLSKAYPIVSELYEDELKYSVLRMQCKEYKEEIEKTISSDRRHKRMLKASLVLLGIVIAGAVLMYIRMMRKKRAEMGRQMTEIILLSRKLEGTAEDNASLSIKLATRQQNVDSLSSRLSSRENEIGGLVSELELNKAENVKLARLVDGLLRSRFSHLNAIISEYARQQESEDDYKIFYKNVAYELDKLRQPKSFQEIERMVDECKDGIIGKIRTQLPGLREKDVTFITLSIAGLSARAIGLFLGVHPNSTYKRRRQLIKYISESNAPDKDWFVDELDI